MARLGKITRQPCVTDPPPPDPRCADPVFQLTHGDICPNVPRIVVSPAFVLVCALSSVQLKAIYIDENFTETDVTDQAVFVSSDIDIAVVGAASGNLTGLSQGEVSVSATHLGVTGFSTVTVLGDDCCAEQNVAMMVMVDISRSMNQPLDSTYQTKLHFAKAAASRFIDEVNETKDLIGLMTFTGTSVNVLSSPIADKAAVLADVAGIGQTNHTTKFFAALTTAIEELDSTAGADLKVIVLISDGQDLDDSYSTDDNPIALLDEFKSAGGIVLCVGARAYGFGYKLLSSFSTGGFFVNAYKATTDTHTPPLPDIPNEVLDLMSGLKGYICAGNCIPEGDEFQATGTLNYCDFEKWRVVNGHVDLVGNGFLDFLPGNGLYVDMAGSTDQFNGMMETRDPVATFGSFPFPLGFSLKFKLAGNQRVDAAATLRVRIISRNNALIPNQVLTTPPSLSDGFGVALLETYEYAVSYTNQHGETELTPAEEITNNNFNAFIITITPDVIPEEPSLPSLVKLWKRKKGTTKWYKIAEGANGAVFTDSMDHAALEAAIEDGTVDPCEFPHDTNTTGIPTVVFEQDVTVDDFRQEFTQYNLDFTATSAIAGQSLWLQFQQIAENEDHPSVGLLLDDITLVFDPDGLNLTFLEDNFDGENIQYVPPKCGTGVYYVPTADSYEAVLISGANDASANGIYVAEGSGWRKDGNYRIATSIGLYEILGPGDATKYECFESDFPEGPWADTGGGSPEPTGAFVTIENYGYVSNYEGCYGEGCLDEPPPAQKQDPNPLADNEKAAPPKLFTGSGQASGSCELGKLYVPISSLLVEGTDFSICPGSEIDVLNHLRWEINVDGAHAGLIAGASVDPEDQLVRVRGNPATTYNVTLRFRGVVEYVVFPGSLDYPFDGIQPLNKYFRTLPGGYPQMLPQNFGNAYYLWTSDPNTWYALNGKPNNPSSNDPYCHPIDYTVTIPIVGKSMVALLSRTRNNHSLTNVVQESLNFDEEPPFSTQGNLILLTGPQAGTKRAIIADVINDVDLEPDDQEDNLNQFVLMNVVAVEEA
jgi:VWA domain-containing protein